MDKSQSPCFPMYPSDFFGDPMVRIMTGDGQAFYALLIMNMWELTSQYSIQDDDDFIASLLKIEKSRWFSEIKPQVLKCLKCENGFLVSPRLKREKEKQDRYRIMQSEKGKLGGRPKKKSYGKATEKPQESYGKANVKPPNPNPNPNPIIKKERVKKEKKVSRKPKTPLTDNFSISPAVEVWAKNKGHTRLDEHLESFKAKCRANGYQYVDWDAAFMEAIRSDWAQLKPTGGNHGGIRTARSDPRDKSLQSQEDADVARITSEWVAKKSARRDTGGDAGNDDAPDFQREP